MLTKNDDTIPIAGFPVARTDARKLARRLLGALDTGSKATLFFANTNFIVQCRAQLPRMRDDAVIIVNDGVGLDIAAFLLRCGRFPQNLNGTDFTPYLFQRCERPLRLFLVLVQAMRLEWLFRLCLEPRRLMRRYTVDIVRFLGHCHRYRLPLAPAKGPP